MDVEVQPVNSSCVKNFTGGSKEVRLFAAAIYNLEREVNVEFVYSTDNMLMRSQPLDEKTSERFKLQGKEEFEAMTEQNIVSQRVGKMFDDILSENEKLKIDLRTRLDWKKRDIKGKFFDWKYVFRNRSKWRKTLNQLRPWEGFYGLICVMQTHLRDYIETEEKYGHSSEDFRNKKIATAKETVELLERMKEPDEYYHRLREEVEVRYPEYKSLITKYLKGGTSVSGRFIAQGDGWVGMESGKDPRKGYFEFAEGRFELSPSPDQAETDRLLDELTRYNDDIATAYKQAEADSNKDFDQLALLLKENLYSWWD